QGPVSSSESMELQLVQGPAANATVTTGESFVHAGGSAPLAATVKDALDRPRPGAQLALIAEVGRLDEVKDQGPGKIAARWRVHEEADIGQTALTVRAWGPVGSEPAKIACWVEGARLYAAVTDLAGLPVPSQALKVGARDVTTD